MEFFSLCIWRIRNFNAYQMNLRRSYLSKKSRFGQTLHIIKMLLITHRFQNYLDQHKDGVNAANNVVISREMDSRKYCKSGISSLGKDCTNFKLEPKGHFSFTKHKPKRQFYPPITGAAFSTLHHTNVPSAWNHRPIMESLDPSYISKAAVPCTSHGGRVNSVQRCNKLTQTAAFVRAQKKNRRRGRPWCRCMNALCLGTTWACRSSKMRPCGFHEPHFHWLGLQKRCWLSKEGRGYFWNCLSTNGRFYWYQAWAPDSVIINRLGTHLCCSCRRFFPSSPFAAGSVCPFFKLFCQFWFLSPLHDHFLCIGLFNRLIRCDWIAVCCIEGCTSVPQFLTWWCTCGWRRLRLLYRGYWGTVRSIDEWCRVPSRTSVLVAWASVLPSQRDGFL